MGAVTGESSNPSASQATPSMNASVTGASDNWKYSRDGPPLSVPSGYSGNPADWNENPHQIYLNLSQNSRPATLDDPYARSGPAWRYDDLLEYEGSGVDPSTTRSQQPGRNDVEVPIKDEETGLIKAEPSSPSPRMSDLPRFPAHTMDVKEESKDSLSGIYGSSSDRESMGTDAAFREDSASDSKAWLGKNEDEHSKFEGGPHPSVKSEQSSQTQPIKQESLYTGYQSLHQRHDSVSVRRDDDRHKTSKQGKRKVPLASLDRRDYSEHENQLQKNKRIKDGSTTHRRGATVDSGANAERADNVSAFKDVADRNFKSDPEAGALDDFDVGPLESGGSNVGGEDVDTLSDFNFDPFGVQGDQHWADEDPLHKLKFEGL